MVDAWKASVVFLVVFAAGFTIYRSATYLDSSYKTLDDAGYFPKSGGIRGPVDIRGPCPTPETSCPPAPTCPTCEESTPIASTEQGTECPACDCPTCPVTADASSAGGVATTTSQGKGTPESHTVRYSKEYFKGDHLKGEYFDYTKVTKWEDFWPLYEQWYRYQVLHVKTPCEERNLLVYDVTMHVGHGNRAQVASRALAAAIASRRLFVLRWGKNDGGTKALHFEDMFLPPRAPILYEHLVKAGVICPDLKSAVRLVIMKPKGSWVQRYPSIFDPSVKTVTFGGTGGGLPLTDDAVVSKFTSYLKPFKSFYNNIMNGGSRTWNSKVMGWLFQPSSLLDTVLDPVRESMAFHYRVGVQIRTGWHKSTSTDRFLFEEDIVIFAQCFNKLAQTTALTHGYPAKAFLSTDSDKARAIFTKHVGAEHVVYLDGEILHVAGRLNSKTAAGHLKAMGDWFLLGEVDFFIRTLKSSYSRTAFARQGIPDVYITAKKCKGPPRDPTHQIPLCRNPHEDSSNINCRDILAGKASFPRSRSTRA